MNLGSPSTHFHFLPLPCCSGYGAGTVNIHFSKALQLGWLSDTTVDN